MDPAELLVRAYLMTLESLERKLGSAYPRVTSGVNESNTLYEVTCHDGMVRTRLQRCEKGFWGRIRCFDVEQPLDINSEDVVMETVCTTGDPHCRCLRCCSIPEVIRRLVVKRGHPNNQQGPLTAALSASFHYIFDFTTMGCSLTAVMREYSAAASYKVVIPDINDTGLQGMVAEGPLYTMRNGSNDSGYATDHKPKHAPPLRHHLMRRSCTRPLDRRPAEGNGNGILCGRQIPRPPSPHPAKRSGNMLLCR